MLESGPPEVVADLLEAAHDGVGLGPVVQRGLCGALLQGEVLPCEWADRVGDDVALVEIQCIVDLGDEVMLTDRDAFHVNALLDRVESVELAGEPKRAKSTFVACLMRGLEALDDCDVALFFTRRLEIDGEQLGRIEAELAADRPPPWNTSLNSSSLRPRTSSARGSRARPRATI